MGGSIFNLKQISFEGSTVQFSSIKPRLPSHFYSFLRFLQSRKGVTLLYLSKAFDTVLQRRFLLKLVIVVYQIVSV